MLIFIDSKAAKNGKKQKRIHIKGSLTARKYFSHNIKLKSSKRMSQEVPPRQAIGMAKKSQVLLGRKHRFNNEPKPVFKTELVGNYYSFLTHFCNLEDQLEHKGLDQSDERPNDNTSVKRFDP